VDIPEHEIPRSHQAVLVSIGYQPQSHHVSIGQHRNRSSCSPLLPSSPSIEVNRHLQTSAHPELTMAKMFAPFLLCAPASSSISLSGYSRESDPGADSRGEERFLTLSSSSKSQGSLGVFMKARAMGIVDEVGNEAKAKEGEKNESR
jgi:hypothetical protein